MIKIFIICLKKEPRNLNLINNLKNLNLNYTIIKAVNGNKYDLTKNKNYNEFLAKIFTGNTLSSSEIGCFLSHIKVCNCIIKSKSRFNLVLEDDAMINYHLFKKVEKLIETNYELVRFCQKKNNTIFFKEDKNLQINRIFGNLPGFHFYYINLNGAHKLKYLSNNIFCPIDVILNIQVLSKLDKLILFEKTLSEENKNSSIKNRKKKSQGIFIFFKLLFRQFTFIFNFFYYFYFLIRKIFY